MNRWTYELADRIEADLEVFTSGRPEYAVYVGFMGKVLSEQVRLASHHSGWRPAIDEKIIRERLDAGFPLVDRGDMPLMPARAFNEAFTTLARMVSIQRDGAAGTVQLHRILDGLAKGKFDPEPLAAQLLCGDAGRTAEEAKRLDVEEPIFEFLISAGLRAVALIWSAAFSPWIQKDAWYQCTCPVCGSFPSLAEIRGEEGRRFLLCSLCAFEWPIVRIGCPICGNHEQDRLRYFYIEGALSGYRVEVCESCRNYIKALDLRSAGRAPLLVAEEIKTVDLDLLANEEGYSPPYWPGHLTLIFQQTP